MSKIWANLVKKFKPPEWPLLEVRRFFHWRQGMSLGILKRFREKNPPFFDFVALVPDLLPHPIEKVLRLHLKNDNFGPKNILFWV